MPKVSVIIPNYNHAIYLKERIDSILNQTFEDFELIILDDCSTDNSKDIINSYRSNNKIAQIVFNQENSGSPFKQWQKGIVLASGEYIWIAESDDVADPDFLNQTTKKLDTNSSINLVFCGSVIIDDQGKEISLGNWGEELSPARWQKEYINTGFDEIAKYLVYKNIITNASAVLFRKDALTAVHLEKITSFRYCGDWMFWIDLILGGLIAYTPQRLNYFRLHANTTRAAKYFQNEFLRIKEYFTVIKYASKIAGDIDPKKHEWVIEEWIFRRKFLSNHFKYLFPPIPYSHYFVFYKLLVQKSLKDLFLKLNP